jgi:hypothetical protein
MSSRAELVKERSGGTPHWTAVTVGKGSHIKKRTAIHPYSIICTTLNLGTNTTATQLQLLTPIALTSLLHKRVNRVEETTAKISQNSNKQKQWSSYRVSNIPTFTRTIEY